MSKQEKCGRTDCEEYLTSYVNNCTLHGDSMAKNDCDKYFDEAPGPQDSLGSGEFTLLSGVLAEAQKGFADAKQMREQFKKSGHVNKEEFWRGEAMAFFKIITFIKEAT